MPGSMLKHQDLLADEINLLESPLQDFVLPEPASKKPVSGTEPQIALHDSRKSKVAAYAVPAAIDQDRLLNAREVAAKLGVSERWVRDHTTRRSPKIRAVKLGWLIRYRRADVDSFMEHLDTLRSSRNASFGV